MSKLRILVADDHDVVRRGVSTMFQAHPEWEICGEAATGSEAIRKTKLLEPDILLLDLGMPDLSGRRDFVKFAGALERGELVNPRLGPAIRAMVAATLIAADRRIHLTGLCAGT